MAESGALLVDEVFPEQPVRQWVLSVPYPLRFQFASRPADMGRVLGKLHRVDVRYQHQPVNAHMTREGLLRSVSGPSPPSERAAGVGQQETFSLHENRVLNVR